MLEGGNGMRSEGAFTNYYNGSGLDRCLIFARGYELSLSFRRFLRRGCFLGKYPRKDFVDILELPLQIKGALDFCPRHSPADLGILHQSISVLARDTTFDQVEQQLSTENQAARALEIRQHALGIDEHSLDQVRRLVQQVIGERGGI